MLKNPAILFASLLLAGLLALGITRLFELRFERGDNYPPYSTLRADPLGASAFYESLQRVSGVTSRRYFEKVLKEDEGRGRALFILGVEPYDLRFLSRTEADTLRRFVMSGGRVVVSYFPEVSKNWSTREKEKESELEKKKAGTPQPHKPGPGGDKVDPEENPPDDRSGGKKRPDSKPEDDTPEKLDMVDLQAEWGFTPEFRNLGTNQEGGLEFAAARREAGPADLSPAISVHTALYFSKLADGWKAVYRRDDLPVVVERAFGSGSVVLVADSYCVSNEALFKEPDPQLLAWLVGRERDVMFDEAHLGVTVAPGVASLMRKYRLHGLIFSLLLLAGLFIWKNSLSLVPPAEEGALAQAGPVVAGKDSIAGFVNLIRRSVPPAEILNLCHAEWMKSASRRAALSAAQRQKVEELVRREQQLAPRQRRPVETYREICAELYRRK